MTETILVNKVKIEKSIINQFLMQNKKLEAVKYICEKANIGLGASKDIVDGLAVGTTDTCDSQDLYLSEKTINEKKSQVITIENTSLFKSKTGKYLVIGGIILLFGFLSLIYYIGFSHIG
jgi:hypothetical protein